jgi:hypothetical protein
MPFVSEVEAEEGLDCVVIQGFDFDRDESFPIVVDVLVVGFLVLVFRDIQGDPAVSTPSARRPSTSSGRPA